MNARDYLLILRSNLTAYLEQAAWAFISFFLVAVFIHFLNKAGWDFFSSDELPIDRKYFPLITWLVLFIFSKDWVLQLWNNFWSNSADYYLDIGQWPYGWIWQGAPGIQGDGLIITNCGAGCLLENRVWKNFRANLTIAWPVIHQSREGEVFPNKLGLIFRADDLENYYMLQIQLSNNAIRVNPHVRLGGNWEAMSGKDNQIGYFELDNDKMQKGFPIELLVVNDRASVKVNGVKATQWFLPTHANLKQETKDFLPNRVIPQINFRDKAGMFGLRNFKNESCLVKSLSIARLN